MCTYNSLEIDLLIQAKKTDLLFKDKKKITCLLVDFTVPADQVFKKKVFKQFNLSRKLKMWYKRNVTVIPVVVGLLRTVPMNM